VTNRDEYVQKLKAQIDQWNAEAARWEEKARNAQAGMQLEYQHQLENLRAKSEQAMAELRRLQHASTDAFSEMMRGADAAMQSMADAFERARRSFDKK
jgi:lipid II:glycine glycyltransferase (peptidoglycan interpeptide bridge formation enzyme)